MSGGLLPGCCAHAALPGLSAWYMQPPRRVPASMRWSWPARRGWQYHRQRIRFSSPLWLPTCRVRGGQRCLLQVLPARPALQQQSPGLRLARQRGMRHGSFAAVAAVAAASAAGQSPSSPAPALPAIAPQPAWACLLVRRVLRIVERPLEINRSHAPPGHAAALRQHGEGWLVWTWLCHALPSAAACCALRAWLSLSCPPLPPPRSTSASWPPMQPTAAAPPGRAPASSSARMQLW